MANPLHCRGVSGSLWHLGLAPGETTLSFSTLALASGPATPLAVVPLSPAIAIESTVLPQPFHKDPADEVIVATSRVLGFPLVTHHGKILAYPLVTLAGLSVWPTAWLEQVAAEEVVEA